MKLFVKTMIALLLIGFPGVLRAQTEDIIIKGIVTNKADRSETLMGVNIQELDVSSRVVGMSITDYNGQYVIRVKNANNKLVFNYLGFKKQTFEIGRQRVINVEMEEEALTLSEAVVTGQRMHTDGSGFVIPEREISTAMQTINAKDFEGLQVGTLDEALQGRVAGLDIVSSSGNPGSGSSMRIRGTSSITGNKEPLIVLNGIPYEVDIKDFDFATSNEEDYAELLSINPDDIEQITVLKDAASTAIWGSKGANGVLMVTTKRGKAGPTLVQYTYRFTRAVQPKGMKMLNGDDYSMMIKQAYFNPMQNETAADIDEFKYSDTFVEYENFNNNTDWVKAVSQTGYTHDHYVNVSGGGERATFRISGGFYDQTGTIIEQHLNRFTSKAHLDYAVSDRLKIISDFSFTHVDNQRNYSNLLGTAYSKMPNVSIYEQDREGNDTDVFYNISRNSSLNPAQRDMINPVAIAKLGVNNLKSYRVVPTFQLHYNLTGDHSRSLKYQMYVSFDINNNKNSGFLPWEATNNLWNSSDVNRSESNDSESLSVQTENVINWQPKLGNDDHSLTVYGALQTRTGNSGSQNISSYGLFSANTKDASNEAYLQNVATGRSNWRSMGLVGRVHYAYKSKYIISGVLRRDGSTKFGNKRKFGNFPGISLKWIVSDEVFMANTSSWLSMLAFRPSWGMSGSQPGAEYLHFSRYAAYDSYLGKQATRPVSLRLSDLKWATVSSWNLGADVGFFKDKIVLDMNYYHKRTEDMLFTNISLPSTSGFGSLSYANAGTMDNDGWEFNVYTNRLYKSGDFSVDVNFNISNYVNTIIALDERILANYNKEYDFRNGTYMTRLQEGHSFGSIYGFEYEGVYQYDEYDEEHGHTDAPVARDAEGRVITDEKGKPLPMVFAAGTTVEYEFRGGDAKYKDQNNDGSIDELDIVYLGNCNPLFNGGMGLTLRYKTFTCTAFFNYRYGNKVVNAARMNAENMYDNDNQSIAVNWRWRKDGDITEIPRALYNYGYNWLGSDRFVEDASFLRFKYLTFNYVLPSNWLKPLGISRVSTYLTFNNLYVFTKYSGMDPEIGYGNFGISTDNAQTPRSRDFTMGLTIGF